MPKYNMIKRMSIRLRLMLLVLVQLMAIAVIIWYGLSDLRTNLLEDRKESIKYLVQVARGIVADWYDKEKSGALSRDQAQNGAREQIAQLRFADQNYFFIQRYDGVTTLHSADRTLEGKQRINVTDPNGVATVRLQIEAAKRGGDYVRYRNPRAGGTTNIDSKNLLSKMSYTLGFEPWQWAIGAGIYIDDVDAVFNRNLLNFSILAGIVVAAAVALALLIARSISRPLSVITERMARLASGDPTVEVPFLGDPHEMGRLSHALEVFKVNRRKADELGAAQQVEQAAKLKRQETLENLIGDFQGRAACSIEAVVRTAQHVQAHAGNVAAMATQSRSNTAAVSHAASDTKGNVRSIAVAVEQLAAAVGEVNKQVVQSTGIAERAVGEADRTTLTMNSLAGVAHRIGAIVRMIQEIASQTNLLALNATIEAARAGETGRGFAVVASEVKTLASQTTRATEEVQAQIAAIQSETALAGEAIGNIGKTVRDMYSFATGIAAAMEEQAALTREIARNIGQTADATTEVSSNIADIAKTAETTTEAAASLHGGSDDLRREATSLNQEMAGFFDQVRAV